MKRIWTGIALLALVTLIFYAWNKEHSKAVSVTIGPSAAHANNPLAAAPLRTAASAPEPSLQSMVRLLAQFANPDADLNDLLHHLESSGQEPEVARDINPYTGEMDIIHTRSPLVGTRYFLGQFFVDESGKRFAQHLSFEYRPSPNAVQETIAALQLAFSGLGAPSAQYGDFMEWNVGHGYVVWLKRLSQDDISQPDPDKVYNSEDVGTVRVALEINPDAH